ncbi:hypothetical protein [Flavobacterium foetidum]|uniref:hypothetical protein n=1 Tax=Flavobacterium foetidum TaxID=2026681 RepID=UPI00107583B6|nr:hypothetical protein [Flavobacterium foetidum]KAF2515961.1 hypothetical protein E0W73_06820 [Flavobacterium foetidum]
MKNLQKKSIFLLTIGLLLNNHCIQSQNSKEIEIYKWLDKNLGIESLDIKNGAAHLNFDKTINNQNRYYQTDNFRKGNVNYNNQNYFDLLLKYDIYKDDLVLNPYDEANNTKINLIKENVISFTINNEKFVNLKNLPASFKGGFYEEIDINNDITLYIKHLKEKKKLNKVESDEIEYIPANEFILLKEKKLNLINDKKAIIALFPDSKRKINDYYFMNGSLRKENQALFIKNLILYINN